MTPPGRRKVKDGTWNKNIKTGEERCEIDAVYKATKREGTTPATRTACARSTTLWYFEDRKSDERRLGWGKRQRPRVKRWKASKDEPPVRDGRIARAYT